MWTPLAVAVAEESRAMSGGGRETREEEVEVSIMRKDPSREGRCVLEGEKKRITVVTILKERII